MSAKRVIDDHLELANIGTKTHANIEGHIQGIGNYAFPAADGALSQILETDGVGALSWVNKPAEFACGDLSACSLSQLGTRPHSQLTGIGTSDHHVKYTNVEAVAAVLADDKYIRNTGDTGVGEFTYDGSGLGTAHLPCLIIGSPAAPPGMPHSYIFQCKDSTEQYGMNIAYDVVADSMSLKSNYWGGGHDIPIILGCHGYYEDQLTLYTNGYVGVRTATPTSPLDINGDRLRIRTAKTPASAGAAGNAGDLCGDADYIYRCVATNSWKRTAINAW